MSTAQSDIRDEAPAAFQRLEGAGTSGMDHQLKPLPEQVIVITGASSGIGLATARMAAQAGARVLLVARNESVLRRIVEDLRADGADADCVAADVSHRESHARIAQTA